MVVTDSEIHIYTRVMTLMSMAYILRVYTLDSLLDPVGIVMANCCCNMIIRFVAAARVIMNTFSDQGEQPIPNISSLPVPHVTSLRSTSLSGQLCLTSHREEVTM